MKDAILFDLDGTLWDAAAGTAASWNQVLAEHPEAGSASLTCDQLRAYMGKTTAQIARLMMPALPEDQALAIMEQCSRREHAYLRAHGGGRLYPELLSTLSVLRETYDLYIVSNCESGYIEIFLDLNNAWDLFSGFACPGDTGLLKDGNIRVVLERAGRPRAFYLGDTDGDERAARAAGVPFVHAAYGFGRAEAPDAVLREFSDLPALAQRLFTAQK